MITETMRCVICGELMEEGFILDFKENAQKPARWVKGEPQRTALGYTAFSDRPNYHISAYRCSGCGHLDFFATDSPKHGVK